MRLAFCARMVEAAAIPEIVFLTGDLGYKALEPLQAILGPRFINAGVSEQNMVSMAAGLTRSGMRAWAYSIAPFAYARPFEQIRNDVCLHKLPVIVVGNGGGYGYGVMGATHHALEDYGIMLALQNMRAFVPVFDEDLVPMIQHLCQTDAPAYLRLGVSEKPKDYLLPEYAPWRQLLAGAPDAATIVVTGPLVGSILDAALKLPAEQQPSIWVISELPITELPEAFLAALRSTPHLITVEEHVAQGGMGAMLASRLLAEGVAPRRFSQRTALGYISGRYGSQKYHRKECGLDPESVLALAASTPEKGTH